MQLEIEGNKWKLVWGLGAFENLCNTLNISLQDIDVAIVTNDTAVVHRLAYCALENGAEIEDKELDFNYKKFLAWLDEQSEETAKDIIDDFMKSKFLGKTVEARYQEIIDRLDAATAESGVTQPVKKKSKRSVKSS